MRAASPRVRLQLDERRAQLIERGRELFNSKSYDDISIDDIAKAAGISKGLLYHYFPGKRPYYVETVRAGAAHMMDMTAADLGLSPEEQLRHGLEAYLDYVDANARAYGALLRSGVGVDPEVAAIVEQTREVMMKRVAKGMGLDKPKGAVRLALRAWIGLVESAALDWADRREVTRDDLIALFTNTLVAAVTTAHGSTKKAARKSRRD